MMALRLSAHRGAAGGPDEVAGPSFSGFAGVGARTRADAARTG